MIVVRSSIAEHIIKVLEQADLDGRSIQYIALSEEEYKELVKDTKSVYCKDYCSESTLCVFAGTQIVGLGYHMNNVKESK